ncbi:hypothetical protein [Cupriavidus nantongensis]|uniref:hypothetical protein n=1 Tax=Cupriavidus nantongensis TaxID=1796606 RepID=UPI0022483A50|nr:hypothetical protein [Cupriavidus nantongensis]
MKERQEKNGVCKLTGVTGKYIKAHIIPAALTRPPKKGNPFVEAGMGRRPKRAWSSWTDHGLVTQCGEDILTELDTWAIPILRSNWLVWSGWDSAHRILDHKNNLSEHFTYDREKGHGIRIVRGIDTPRLRMFFLSLLWRAAASERPEFEEIQLPDTDLELLRLALVNRTPPPSNFYPAIATQLSTRSHAHNFTPIYRDLAEADATLPKHNFRFYLDGLIVNFYAEEGFAYEQRMGKMPVGTGSDLFVSTVTYEKSFQLENFKQMVSETFIAWPEDSAKLM